MPTNLYGYTPPPLPPSVDVGMEIEPPEAPEPKGVMVMGEIRNIEIEADMAPVGEAMLGLGVAIAAVEDAVLGLPGKMPPPPPTDLSPIIDAIDRLASIITANHADMKAMESADEGPVTQTIERDARGLVVSITTKKGKAPARKRTVIRNASGFITGTTEE